MSTPTRQGSLNENDRLTDSRNKRTNLIISHVVKVVTAKAVTKHDTETNTRTMLHFHKRCPGSRVSRRSIMPVSLKGMLTVISTSTRP